VSGVARTSAGAVTTLRKKKVEVRAWTGGTPSRQRKSRCHSFATCHIAFPRRRGHPRSQQEMNCWPGSSVPVWALCGMFEVNVRLARIESGRERRPSWPVTGRHPVVMVPRLQSRACWPTATPGNGPGGGKNLQSDGQPATWVMVHVGQPAKPRLPKPFCDAGSVISGIRRCPAEPLTMAVRGPAPCDRGMCPYCGGPL